MISVGTVVLNTIYSYSLVLFNEIYNVILQIINDPVVRFTTRALIAQPILDFANFIGTVYLGLYSFVTNDVIKYLFWIGYIIPVWKPIVWYFRSIRIFFRTIFSGL
jgi:hypothetical protein